MTGSPLGFVAIGALTGALVATTGLGGGSVLTPALLFMGVPPSVVIGTDLVIASITKFGAGWRHHLERNVDWRTVALLAIGSLPAGYIASLTNIKVVFLLRILAVALILTGISILGRQRMLKNKNSEPKAINIPLPLVGAVVGVLVGLTSVGSGAMLALALTFIMPKLIGARFAGTDVAHGVMLSMVAAFGHAQRGGVDLQVVGWVLLGALPSAWIMAGLAPKMPERFARPLLGSVLTLVGTVLIFK